MTWLDRQRNSWEGNVHLQEIRKEGAGGRKKPTPPPNPEPITRCKKSTEKKQKTALQEMLLDTEILREGVGQILTPQPAPVFQLFGHFLPFSPLSPQLLNIITVFATDAWLLRIHFKS